MRPPENLPPEAGIHRESNRQSRDAWVRFTAHRHRVTGLVLDVIGEGGLLCVIGAGNVNDLDLGRVLTLAAGVVLVDIDDEAVRGAVARHGLQRDDRVVVHGGDAFGVADALRAPVEAAVDAAADAVSRHALPFSDGTFDVVLSAGALTQAFQSVVGSALDADRGVAVTIALRDHHLREMTRLLRPGGHAILVSDTVATSTAPHLRATGGRDLEAEMAALVASGNFFTGTNPYRVMAVLEEDEVLRGMTADVALHDPWLWAVTPDREHLTYAVTWRRR